MPYADPDVQREYTRQHNRKRMAERREALVQQLGGKCAQCDAIDELHFDHVDPATKLFDITSNLNRRWTVLLAEVAKCQLLCPAHHAAKTAGEPIKRAGEYQCSCGRTFDDRLAFAGHRRWC